MLRDYGRSRRACLQRIRVDELHDDAMPGLVDRSRDGEAVFVKHLRGGKRCQRPHSRQRSGLFHVVNSHLHERPLLLSREPGHVHPRCGLALAHVVPLGLDRAEGNSAEPLVYKSDYQRRLGTGRGTKKTNLCIFMTISLPS